MTESCETSGELSPKQQQQSITASHAGLHSADRAIAGERSSEIIRQSGLLIGQGTAQGDAVAVDGAADLAFAQATEVGAAELIAVRFERDLVPRGSVDKLEVDFPEATDVGDRRPRRRPIAPAVRPTCMGSQETSSTGKGLAPAGG